MPQIVIIVDELADLMMVAGQRGGGIHLSSGAAGPRGGDSSDHRHPASLGQCHHGTDQGQYAFPGLLFPVTSNIDSRTILDMGGAEKTAGKRRYALTILRDFTKPLRVQGAFVTDDEWQRWKIFCPSITRPEPTARRSRRRSPPAEIGTGSGGDRGQCCRRQPRRLFRGGRQTADREGKGIDRHAAAKL